METKGPHVTNDEEIDLLLQDLKSKSSPSSMMYVKHLLSSVVPPQRMKSKECSEWYHELCTEMERECALRLLVFAVTEAHCDRDESKKLMELANIKNKPCLNDFRYLDEFNYLALNNLMADIAYQGVGVRVVQFLARHKLHCHPDKYLPAGATDISFEGCLLLLNDAVQSEVFTLDNLSPLREILKKERKATKVVDAFQEELAQSAIHPPPSAPHPTSAANVTGTHQPVTAPYPGYPPTMMGTAPAHLPSSAHPMQPPPPTAYIQPPVLPPPPQGYAPNQILQAPYPQQQMQQFAGQYGAPNMFYGQQYPSPPPYVANQPQIPNPNYQQQHQLQQQQLQQQQRQMEQQPQQMDASTMEPAQRMASQSPHSSQSTHPAHQQNEECSLEAPQRDRSASDSLIQRGSRAGTNPSPFSTGQLLSSVSSSGFSSQGGSISEQQTRSRGSSLTSRIPSQESKDGVYGSSEIVASSERLYPDIQTPKDQLRRQNYVEEGPQLEKQS